MTRGGRAAFASAVRDPSRRVGSTRHPAARARVWRAPRTPLKRASERFVAKRKVNLASSAGHPAFSIARTIYRPVQTSSDSGWLDGSSGHCVCTGFGEPTGGFWTARVLSLL